MLFTTSIQYKINDILMNPLYKTKLSSNDKEDILDYIAEIKQEECSVMCDLLFIGEASFDVCLFSSVLSIN